MNYYRLTFNAEKYDRELEDSIMCLSKEEDLFDIDQITFHKGEKIEQWDKRIKLYYTIKDGKTPTDFFSNSLGWEIFSENTKRCIETSNINIKNIQFLPIQIECQENKKILHYYVLNITNKLAAFDFEQSKCNYFEFEGKKYLDAEIYKIDKSKLKGMIYLN